MLFKVCFKLVINRRFIFKQPGLANLKSSDRGYWYEQYRREAFDFDSQSVRPYFPYQSVQKGILDTAARLFQGGLLASMYQDRCPGWSRPRIRRLVAALAAPTARSARAAASPSVAALAIYHGDRLPLAYPDAGSTPTRPGW